MIQVTSNIDVVIRAKLDEIQALKNNADPILRTVAIAVLSEMKVRVHKKGLDSAGNKIGTYSPGYMKIRTGNFTNAPKVTRGANKGNFKDKKKAGDAGKYTKGESVGSARNIYNRTSDPTVVLSLTRQMENDETVVQTDNGYGIGFLNSDNYQKALYCEATYNKKILTELTSDELELAKQTAIDFLPEYFKTN